MRQFLNLLDPVLIKVTPNTLKVIAKTLNIFKSIFSFTFTNIIIGIILAPIILAAANWLISHLAFISTFSAVYIVTGIVILYILALYAHNKLYPTKVNKNIFTIELKKLNFKNHSLILNLGENSPRGFFSRPQDNIVREKMLRLRNRHSGGGIAITGLNSVGKTRLALEIAREVFRSYTLVIWPNFSISNEEINVLENEKVVVLLDDINEIAEDSKKAKILYEKVRYLRRIASDVILLITYPSLEEDKVSKRFSNFFRDINAKPILIEPMIPNSKEGNEFINFAYKQQKKDRFLVIEKDLFDGNPGSIFLGLEARKKQLGKTPYGAKSILKTLLLLYRMHMLATTETVKTLARGLFNINDENWKNAIYHLETEHWIILTRGAQLKVPNVNYLTVCLPDDGYTEEQQVLDLNRLVSILPKQDTKSRFAISNVFYENHLYQDGLRTLKMIISQVEARSKEWADAQYLTGLIYSDLSQGENVNTQELTITSYNNALSVYTFEINPIEWAITQNNLGNTLQHLDEGDREINLESSISAYEESLRVFTPDEFPTEYAETKSNIGDNYQELAKYRRENKRDAYYQAISSFQDTLQIYTPESYPEEFVEAQTKIGNIYQFELRSGTTDAVSAYSQALEYSPKTLDEKRATILVNLAGALTDRAKEKDLDRAIEYCQTALNYREKTEHKFQWAYAQNILGNAYLKRNSRNGKDIEAAIACYELASSCFDDRSEYWAVEQNNLGLAYKKQRTNNNEGEILSLEKAEMYFNLAIEVYRENDLTFLLAKSLANRGLLYLLYAELERRSGNPDTCRQNCIIARSNLNEALTTIKSEDFPYHYGRIKQQLAVVSKQQC